MSATVHFRLDPKVKEEAQIISKEMGLTLSSVINAFLHDFVRTRTLSVSLDQPSKYLKDSISSSEKEISENKSSPIFTDPKRGSKWLEGD